MYKAGDLILYGSTGICRITDITKLDFGGKPEPYYVLKPLFQNETIYCTVAQTKIFIRSVITADEANRLIDNIPTIDAEACVGKSVQELTSHYQAATQTFDCADLLELTLSIHAKKQLFAEQNRKFGQVDERFMRRAEDMLHEEFSVALGIPKSEVSKYIHKRLAIAPSM